MKKVIVTTFFKAENYGAALQAYALQNVLMQKGYDVEILNFRDSAIEDSYRIINIRRANMYLTIRAFISMILFYRKKKERHNQFLGFQKNHLKIGGREYWSSEEVLDNPPEADIYITGSDQVWNSLITKEISDIYTLNFGSDKICRVAYAASIGTKRFRPNEGSIFGEKILKINAVSVREVTAKSALDPFLGGKSVDVTLDPVLLRRKEEWEDEIAGVGGKREKYILAYRIGENTEYWEVVNALSKKSGLKIIHFEIRNKYSNTLRSEYTAGPLKFVNLIKYAEYVVTTSFHGTAFSLLFQKKFWVVLCKPRESRIVDLLNTLKCPERMVYTLEEFLTKDYDSKVDYEKVDAILDKERERSLQWLSAAMGEKDL